MGYGGAERVVLQLCQTMRTQFHQIVVCSCGGIHEAELKALGICHVQIPDIDRKNPFLMARTLIQLARVVRRERIGVVHTHHRMAALYARLLSAFLVFRHVYTAHNVFHDRRRLTRFALKGSLVVAVSACVAENLRDIYGVACDRVVLNAVEPHAGMPEGRPLIAEYGCAGKLLIGVVGRLSAQKGIEYFLRAIPLMRHTGKCLFFVVGDGEKRSALEALASELGIRGRVRFLGFRADARAIVGQLDIIALPSLWEGLPLVPMEAFAAGRPVVASDVGGVSEVVRDGYNGLLVPPRDARALAATLDALVSDSDRRALYGRNAQLTYQERFTIERFRLDYAVFYRSLFRARVSLVIVTPGVLPVPAVRGGAVEEQVELFLSFNESTARRTVTVVSIDDPAARERANRYPHVRFFFVRLPRWTEHLYDAGVLPARIRGLLFARRAGKRLAQIGHGAILVENEYWFGCVLRRRATGGLFLHLHNDYVLPPKGIARWWLRPYDKVLAVSEFLRERVLAVNPPCPVETVYNGLAAAFFECGEASDRDATRTELGFLPEDIVVLYAGRIVPEKGVGELIEAFRYAERRCDRLRLLVVGASFFEGSSETAFVRMLRERCAGVRDRIRFTGYVAHEQMPFLCAAADVGCVPSVWNEPFGMAAAEQMAAGLPLIASDAGALPELVDKSCAIVVPRGEGFIEALSDAIIRLCGDGELRARMGEAARTRAHRLFSGERYGAEMMGALSKEEDRNE